MSIKKQFGKLKDNWLLVLIVLVILGAMSFMDSGSVGLYKSSGVSEMVIADSYGGGVVANRAYMPAAYGDFAPDIQDRKITKNARMTSEVKRGTFEDNEARLKAIIDSSDSYLLNENVNKYDTESKSYLQGYYSFKVDVDKYNSVITQLREIGEVTYFSEDANDITGSYTSIQVELDAEKGKLERYQSMYDEAIEVSDKITLNDRIFDQEQRISYLEDSLENMDQKVDYSTISFTLREKQSEYANVAFIKFSKLVDNFVDSISNLINLFFVLLPWAVVAFIIWFISKLFRRKK